MKREFCSRFGNHGQRLMLAVGLRRELPTTTANGAVIVATTAGYQGQGPWLDRYARQNEDFVLVFSTHAPHPGPLPARGERERDFW